MHELASNGIDTIERYRHEDQAGSLVGITDENGLRTDEYFYLDFGTPIHRPIAFDGQNSRIASVQANTPFAGSTRVNLKSGISINIPANSLNGKQVRVLGNMHVDQVLSSSGLVIDLNDPDGDLYTGLNAGSGFVVMDFESPEVYSNASGTWTELFWDSLADETVLFDENGFFMEGVNVGDLLQPDTNAPDIWFEIVAVDNPQTIRVAGDKTAYTSFGKPYEIKDAIWEYNSLSNTSTYTNENAYFEQFQAGWLFTPDVTKPAYLQVISVDPSGESITIKGNATNLSYPCDQWRIHAPPGVKPETSGQHTDLTETGSKYLLSGSRYMTPQAGFYISSILEGEQTGLNRAGSFYISGNTFDPSNANLFQTEDSLLYDEHGNRRAAPPILPPAQIIVWDYATYKETRQNFVAEVNSKNCHWKQFMRTQFELLINKSIDPAKEELKWADASTGDVTVKTSANGNGTKVEGSGISKLDNKTEYVDSGTKGGEYPGSKSKELGNGRHESTLQDRPFLSVEAMALKIRQLRSHYKKKNGTKSNFAKVWGGKYTVYFTSYLICDGSVVYIVKWNMQLAWTGKKPRGEGSVYKLTKWRTQVTDRYEANKMEDVHGRSLKDYLAGGRNGAE